jgi:hypothetical protein
MSFPKKGKSFPKSGGLNSSNRDGGSRGATSNFALQIATALERTLRDRNNHVRTIQRWTKVDGQRQATTKQQAVRPWWM